MSATPDVFCDVTAATGEEGLSYFQQIMSEAERQKLDFAGILLLAEDQKSWAAKVRAYPKLAVMVRPVTAKQLLQKLHELVPPPVP